MTADERFAFPQEQDRLRQQARKNAHRSIVLVSISGVVLYLATGHSQTMKTAWVTDALSILPSIALLIAFRYELRPPTRRFPFGYFRAVSICFLFTAIVLLSMGLWLFLEAALKLIARDRPPIGAMTLAGQTIWAGWPMIAALAFSLLVGMYSVRIKQPVAKGLHSKAVEAESATNRNEWMSEGAGILGILAVGAGYWWADAAAAAAISLQIVYDGALQLRQVVADLMDETPSKLGGQEPEDLPGRARTLAEREPWVRAARVRLREHGHVVTGDVLVVPADDTDLVARLAALRERLSSLDWRLHSLVIMPVRALDDRPNSQPM
jgi:cation diffusion facilitator family transporter